MIVNDFSFWNDGAPVLPVDGSGDFDFWDDGAPVLQPLVRDAVEAIPYIVPVKNVTQIHIGTGEFALCVGAKTPAEARPPAGFRDIGNVTMYQLVPKVETFSREAASRGRRVVDAVFGVRPSLHYVFECDSWTRDNLLWLLHGTESDNNARTAITDTECDPMLFTAAVPTKADTWYEPLIDGEAVGPFDSITVATEFQELAAGVHYVPDFEVGRIRFLQRFSQTINLTVTASAITSADDNYAVGISPLETPGITGIGRFSHWHAGNRRLRMDHRDFPCRISPGNVSEMTGKSAGTFRLTVPVHAPYGTMWHFGPETFQDYSGN